MVNGQEMELERGATALDVLEKLPKEVKKEALVAKINGNLISLMEPIPEEGNLEILTFADADGRWTLRHTASHVLAQAVKNLKPEAKLAIGPAIENGFYYDFDVEEPFTPEFLKAVEKEMSKIIKKNSKLERFELPRAEALEFVKDEPYKVELINDLPEDSIISFYKQEGFTDLCAGPHLPSTGKIKAFKLMSTAGAYWRGSEKNKMLQRIYGTAFTSREELDAYVQRLEEAKKRDHRKLGRQLDLFDIFDEGPGFPFFFPKGMVLRNLLEEYWREIHRKAGYEEIKTPMILSRTLWERSGHWDHYQNNMYTTKIDDMDFAIKPMNCPGGILVYKRRMWSYRDLPIRSGELGLVHRHELSGALHGLMRVRCFTQDDAHIFMTPDQIRDEIKGVYRLIDEVYSVFGFKYHVELSTRPEDSMGTDEMWEQATDGLQGALDDLGVEYVINEGDGAFYGPKIDFHLEDSIGRTWQCGTIQLDMNLPERFDLTYTGADGEKHRPVMIHRVVFGSIERFIGILTEHFAGAFPVWLAPVQARIMTITDRADAAARELQKKLEDAGIRVETDLRNEKIGFKIREAQMQKIPYMLVLGDKEAEEGTVAVRLRGQGDLGTMRADELTQRILEEVRTKAR
ncbi:MAG TPA: threonine--tRNA ligase [Candidatus Pullichristensenella excrementigallinarum]|uniref:Threonine--tRNA ligase n=1 Tax=Candidatus Pullichristensenella excrementigallinarum TaxID=2840907 RepID=A0A9D1LDI2_9FIRM|nr:threonine--tRNA ligase [Candidatus Pullichristensenella excrementigallinarum]